MPRSTPADPSGRKSAEQSYCPDAHDIIWIDFHPQAGREQAKRRPALVLSPRSYNSKAKLCVVCPITSQAKGYPFEVAVPDGVGVTGVILADQVKSLSWEARNWISTAPDTVAREVRMFIKALIRL